MKKKIQKLVIEDKGNSLNQTTIFYNLGERRTVRAQRWQKESQKQNLVGKAAQSDCITEGEGKQILQQY